MKVLARNLEILLLNHDLVMVPGLGGFLADYQQAKIDQDDKGVMLPPARTIVFNKNLNANDGLMVNAYMRNYDATYPQALRQLELDVEELNEELSLNGFVVIDNIGTLHKNLDGLVSFEQIHNSLVTPELFALPPVRLSAVDELQNEKDIKDAIHDISELPVAKPVEHNGRLKIWRDIAISSAAAVALFFMFVFPNINGNEDEKIVAGANDNIESVKETPKITNAVDEHKFAFDNKQNNWTSAPSQQPQIILLQAPQQAANTVILAPEDINNASMLNNPNGKYTIVVSAAANEECALYVIGQLDEQNIPGAYYHEGNDGKFIFYSNFATAADAQKTLNALKKVSNRFKRAWVRKI